MESKYRGPPFNTDSLKEHNLITEILGLLFKYVQ